MLTKVKATSAQGSILDLPFSDPSGGIVVEKIDGLDPVKATIVSSSVALMDGSQYQSSRRDNRNLVLTLPLKAEYTNDTVRGLRNKLYSFFMPKSEVSLLFSSDDFPDVSISGRVESFEAPLFTQDPKATISMLCFDPDFKEALATQVSSSTTSGTDEITIDYDGTVESGIQFHMDINQALSGFVIYHTPPDNVLRRLDFVEPLSVGDSLDISTVSGAKGATLTRAGSTSSLLYGISPYSNWIELQPGINKLRVYATGTAMPYTITYETRHGGL